MQHPETTRKRDNYADMRGTLEAVLALGRRTLIIYPCSDQGYEEVVRAIEEVPGGPRVSIHQTPRRRTSGGCYPWPQCSWAIPLPASSKPLISTSRHLTWGKRQKGRRQAENVISSEFSQEAVAACLEKALHDPKFA